LAAFSLDKQERAARCIRKYFPSPYWFFSACVSKFAGMGLPAVEKDVYPQNERIVKDVAQAETLVDFIRLRRSCGIFGIKEKKRILARRIIQGHDEIRRKKASLVLFIGSVGRDVYLHGRGRRVIRRRPGILRGIEGKFETQAEKNQYGDGKYFLMHLPANGIPRQASASNIFLILWTSA
jgi:hypothetical protein